MLRDNPEGSSSRWLSSAGGPSPALHVDGRKSSDDRPSCLENPRPAGAESTLTENASSPFHAEPRHPDYDDAMAYLNLMYREKADVECDDLVARAEDLKTADSLVDKTLAVKKAKAEKSVVDHRQ
jgi:hypothetical protein